MKPNSNATATKCDGYASSTLTGVSDTLGDANVAVDSAHVTLTARPSEPHPTPAFSAHPCLHTVRNTFNIAFSFKFVPPTVHKGDVAVECVSFFRLY